MRGFIDDMRFVYNEETRWVWSQSAFMRGFIDDARSKLAYSVW